MGGGFRAGVRVAGSSYVSGAWPGRGLAPETAAQGMLGRGVGQRSRGVRIMVS